MILAKKSFAEIGHSRRKWLNFGGDPTIVDFGAQHQDICTKWLRFQHNFKFQDNFAFSDLLGPLQLLCKIDSYNKRQTGQTGLNSYLLTILKHKNVFLLE